MIAFDPEYSGLTMPYMALKAHFKNSLGLGLA